MSVSAGRLGSWGDSRHQTAPPPGGPPPGAQVSPAILMRRVWRTPPHHHHRRVPIRPDPELEGPKAVCFTERSRPPWLQRILLQSLRSASHLPGATHLRADPHRAQFMSRSAL